MAILLDKRLKVLEAQLEAVKTGGAKADVDSAEARPGESMLPAETGNAQAGGGSRKQNVMGERHPPAKAQPAMYGSGPPMKAPPQATLLVDVPRPCVQEQTSPAVVHGPPHAPGLP